MDPVHRASDGELCGFVASRDGRWRAVTVFGTVLGEHDDRDTADAQVLRDGLASLAERWILRHPGCPEGEVVCIQEANRTSVTVALGYYSMPGVPTARITSEQLATGAYELRRLD